MSTAKQRKPRMMMPDTPRWERMANELARSWVSIVPCRECGAPRVVGYVCPRCDRGDER